MPSSLIRQFPDPVLRKVSTRVPKIDRSITDLVERLIETMKKQPGGVGIAAPQIGVLKQVAIVDVSRKVPQAKLLVLINPEIVSFEKWQVFREGCMSLPDYTANVKRADRVRVKWQGIDLKGYELIANGLEARCIQHEIDHLNGFLFVDRVVSLKSDVFRRKHYL